jgi:hypothetical protein
MGIKALYHFIVSVYCVPIHMFWFGRPKPLVFRCKFYALQRPHKGSYKTPNINQPRQL